MGDKGDEEGAEIQADGEYLRIKKAHRVGRE